MRRSIIRVAAMCAAAVATAAMPAPVAAAVIVRSAGGRIDIADGGASVIRYGVSAGRFLLYASPVPPPRPGVRPPTTPIPSAARWRAPTS